MTGTRKPRRLASFFSVALVTLGSSAAFSQSPRQQADPGVVPDDMLTLVVGTRFVTADAGRTVRALFNGSRIPQSEFNETDHCIDQQALELAKEYFTTLGRVMGKAGHYYVVPDEDVRKAVSMCERLKHGAPKAWAPNTTAIVAFGRVVPDPDAPALEQSIR